MAKTGRPVALNAIQSPFLKKDYCYHKVKRQYKVFPSAYASGAIAKCRKKRARG